MELGDGRDMQALILAGGEGRRMSELTAHVPKPLLYLPGGTVLEHQLALLARLPVSHTFVLVHHRAEDIEYALRLRGDVTVVRQRPPFTLMGALASADGHLGEPFVVLHGDNYFSQQLDYLIAAGEALGWTPDATFVIDPGAGESDQAVRLASTGCYVLSPQLMPLVQSLRRGDALSVLTSALLRGGARIAEARLRGWRMNINRVGELLQASRRILDDWSRCFHPPGADEGYNRTDACFAVEPSVWVSPDSEVTGSRLGRHVSVGPGASIRNCALHEVVVFPGAELADVHLDRGVVVPSEAGWVFLTPDDQVHGVEESQGEEEPP
jgi:NDP-sugar pyrophosphorylase family protein